MEYLESAPEKGEKESRKSIIIIIKVNEYPT
jgi:hypothetical protein